MNTRGNCRRLLATAGLVALLAAPPWPLALAAAQDLGPGTPGDVFSLFGALPFPALAWTSVRTTVRGGKTTQVRELNLLKGQRLKVVTRDPNGTDTVVYADNGDKSLVFYQPATNDGMRMDLKQLGGLTGGAQPAAGRKVGHETLLGRPCEIVESESTVNLMGFPLRVRHRDWLWQRFPLKSVVEIPTPEGLEDVLPATVTTTVVTGIDTAPRIADADLVPPAGAHIEAGQMNLPFFPR